jgi:LmbE family N-acetylglucosaminyl deacetylase
MAVPSVRSDRSLVPGSPAARTTLVFFHAHPDDEAIATAGTMAALAGAGHRVVAVFATRGERGEMPASLEGHASLGELREHEAQRAGRVLGVARVAFLGYEDSGEDPAAAPPGSFWAADPEEAAGLLAALLDAEAPAALVVYDPTGSTKHPDHLQVHRVGRRAAELARPGIRVYETTFAASQLDRLLELTGGVNPGLFVTPDDEVTTVVDVGPWLSRKRAAMAAHASQIGPASFFLSLADDDFRAVWGREFYLDRTAATAGPGPLEAALTDTLAVQIGEHHG